MKQTIPWLFASALLLAPASATPADLPSGSELLERSIRYHDPAGVWGSEPLGFRFDETRPGGGVRKTVVAVDLQAETFSWSSERDGHDVSGRLAKDDCELALDGKREFSAEDAETYRLSCDRVAWMRDYYTYLWGLPMKLTDPGTRLDETVAAVEFEGREVLALRVTYDEEVGADTWYFYFDPSTAALVGYRFFHDETKNDGEYITTEGEFVSGTLRLPDNRAWFYNADDEYLGTDTLVSLSRERAVAD